MRLAKLNSAHVRAHLVVEMVDDGILLFADVTMLQLMILTFGLLSPSQMDITRLKSFWREDIWRGEYRFPAQHANPRLMQHSVRASSLCPLRPFSGFLSPAPGDRIRVVHPCHSPVQTLLSSAGS